MIKKLYIFLHNHPVGTIRTIYFLIFAGALTRNDTIFKCMILICCAISVTVQIGAVGKFDETNEQENG